MFRFLKRGYFNPLLPNGRRRNIRDSSDDFRYFNPLLPNGRRRVAVHDYPNAEDDFNPLLPNGRRRSYELYVQVNDVISIHSFQTEGDHFSQSPNHTTRYFNPLLPNGRRRTNLSAWLPLSIFQSTPSKRKETHLLFCNLSILILFQSTPSKRKETAIMHIIFFIFCLFCMPIAQ